MARGGWVHDIEQLRRDLEEAVAELSPDAQSVWKVLEEARERAVAGEEVAAEMPPEYHELLSSEQAALLQAVRASAAVYAASVAEEEGMVALLRQAAAVITRAQELEPGIGDRATLGEAVAVLSRHGVNPGISPELAEMVVRVPVEAAAEEAAAASLERVLADLAPLQRQVLNVRMNTRAEHEDPAEILGEVLALSDEEAQEYIEDFKRLAEEVVNEVVDERERRERPEDR